MSFVFIQSKIENKQTNHIQESIDLRYSEFLNWKTQVEKSLQNEQKDFWDFNTSYKKDYKEKHFDLFIYENNKIIYWSNSLTIPNTASFQSGIIQFNSGWFLLVNEIIGPYRVQYLMEIKEIFPIKNRYLKEHFVIDEDIPNELKISTEKQSEHAIQIKGYAPFYLDFSHIDFGKTKLSHWNVLAFFLFIASILLLIYSSFLHSNRPIKKGILASLIIVALSLLRLVWLNNPFPDLVFLHPIFNPSVFAQSFLFPSLGDLLINSMLILLFISLIASVINSSSVQDKEMQNKGFAIFFLLITILWIYTLNHLLEGLVKNSRIPFNIDHLFELDIFSLIAMLGIALLFLSYFIWIEAGIKFIYNSKLSFKLFILLSFTVFLLYAAIISGSATFDITESFWSLPVILAIATRNYFNQTRLGLGIGIFNLALISLFLAHVFEKYNIEKEHEIRQVIGDRIAMMQDPLQEIKMGQQISSLQKNDWIVQLFRKDSIEQNEFSDIEVFFNNDWFRYDKSFKKTQSNAFKFDLIKRNGELREEIPLQRTLHPNLYFFHDENLGVGYVFSTPIIDFNDTLGYLQGTFTELSKPISSGFPQLLRSESNYIQSYASEYSYARYFNGKRIFSNNEEYFPIETSEITPDALYSGYRNWNESSILILPEEYGFRWMIGKPIPQLLQKITSFSYLFLFLGLLTVLALLSQRLFQSSPVFYFSFQGKIQLIFIAFIIGILTLYALVIFNQITEQFHQRNKEQITERLNSIHIELRHKLGDVDRLDKVPNNRIASYLLKFSEVFVADISLFDLDGQLSASSSSMIWDKKLLSTNMDPIAYQNVTSFHQSKFIQEEALGNFAYLSGYRPLLNNKGDKIGYLNVPYFARQDELKREISRFLQVLINVFVLLMGIGVIVAIYVSNWITSPLKMLQTSFASLDLVKRNIPIQYSGNDEVASFVNAYNRKVSELEEMTEQIVQSEKESAWQEMARQVAHEIKNPLTPMRLSIQHYQRLLESQKDIATEKTSALMNALIEQIDNLNHIANEFSRFAQISVSVQTEFDLGKLIMEVYELYTHTEGVTLKVDIENDCIVKLDKGQIMRMLNNLIQNAIQATKNEADRVVKLRLLRSSDSYQIEIEDNGTGIPPELEDKIFKPNFTTKSKGMGLGLAIVHTIVKNNNGKISYRNAKIKGTVFVVDLPSS